jgi:hypothetical protein
VLKAISNTSPLLYLYRIGGIQWLLRLFSEIWVPEAVKNELQEGQRKGYDVPNLDDYLWLNIVNPKSTPSEWLTLDLGTGEIAVMALALENPDKVILLDGALARRIAQAAGLQVWGTLKILLEAKSQRIINSVGPYISKLRASGIWISAEVEKRILRLADES